MNSSAVDDGNGKYWLKRVIAGGGILAYVIMAFEVAIMISPFAFFFYSVFNPIFHFLGGSPATRWLTAFFLPHMIWPPSVLLAVVRVLGSVLFVIGAVTFIVCAFQVYLGKLLKWRIASKGLYSVVRHPQYVALIVWGAGMAILWPRFLVLVTLALMITLYYFLAKDEEGRMTRAYGDDYRDYMRRTGRFVPLFIERLVPGGQRLAAYGAVLVPVVALSLTLLAGFGLRAITVAGLPVVAKGNVGVVSILPRDDHLLGGVAAELASLEHAAGHPSFVSDRGVYLAYLMPPDYVMQGMIANTGEQWQLYKRGHTVQMITDWVFHPFRHLQHAPMHATGASSGRGPDMDMSGGCPFHSAAQAGRRMTCPLGINEPQMDCDTCPYRRVIVVKVDVGRVSKQQLFAASAARTPVGYLDIDVRTGEVIHAAAVRDKTAWSNVPTPIF